MNITFESQVFPDDTITVSGSRPAPGFFSKMLGINSVTVHATASARAGYPTQAKWVVPIVVDEKHPKLQCNPNPCSGPTELVYQHFKDERLAERRGQLRLHQPHRRTTSGTSDLGDLIENGWDQYMGLGDYDAITGNMFSSSHIGDNLERADRRRSALPDLPQADRRTGTGAKYEIVGWAGFRLTGLDLHGSNEILLGEFVSVTWDGIQAEKASDAPPDFGVTNVSLVE